jgi:hypothetical protein
MNDNLTTNASNKAESPAFLVGAVITHTLLFPHLPKCIQNSIKVSVLVEEEIYETEKMLGKEKTQELIIQFQNEASAQAGVNSNYIIRKLRDARRGL